MSRRKKPALIPLGDRQWAYGLWRLSQQRDGSWVAVAELNDLPPLFAQSPTALAWLIRNWDRALIQYAANVRKALNKEQRQAGREQCTAAVLEAISDCSTVWTDSADIEAIIAEGAEEPAPVTAVAEAVIEQPPAAPAVPALAAATAAATASRLAPPVSDRARAILQRRREALAAAS